MLSKILRSALVLAVLFIIALTTIDPNRFVYFAVDRLRSGLASQSIGFSISQPHLGYTTLQGSDATVSIKRLAFPIVIQNPIIRFSPLPILWLQPSASILGTTFGGALSGEGSLTILSNEVHSNIELRSVQLAQIPLMRLFGVQGEASLLGQDLTIKGNIATQGRGEFTISKGERPAETDLNLQPFGIPFSLRLPKIQNLELKVAALLDGRNITLSKCESSSSLLEANCRGSAQLDTATGRLSSIDLALEISLSNEGLKFAENYLPLISNGALSMQQNHFEIRITGQLSRPMISYKPL